jgi:hypothetical protein
MNDRPRIEVQASRKGCIVSTAQVVGGVMQDRLLTSLYVLSGIGSTVLMAVVLLSL